jgi:hypothetical protein
VSFRAEVMAKLKVERSKSAHQIRTLLESDSLRPASEEPARTTASEALRLWRTRLRNTKITHKKIDGLPQLVERLKTITPQKKVEYFAFTDEASAITLLFEKTSGAFIGSASVRIEPSTRN